MLGGGRSVRQNAGHSSLRNSNFSLQRRDFPSLSLCPVVYPIEGHVIGQTIGHLIGHTTPVFVHKRLSVSLPSVSKQPLVASYPILPPLLPDRLLPIRLILI